MIRLLLGALAAVALALVFTGWRLNVAKGDRDNALNMARIAQESAQAAISELGNTKVAGKALEREIARLRADDETRRENLVTGVSEIRSARQPSGGKPDESFKCLDVAVAGPVDRRLRSQTDRGDAARVPGGSEIPDATRR